MREREEDRETYSRRTRTELWSAVILIVKQWSKQSRHRLESNDSVNEQGEEKNKDENTKPDPWNRKGNVTAGKEREKLMMTETARAETITRSVSRR